MKADLAERCDTSVSEDVARSTLDDLLTDTRFRVTERGKSIIKYIAAHYFSGKIEGIKGYSIAIDVLGRPTNFDPSIDPIVRIELSRLRTALFQYYEAYGHELDVLVEIPKGKYTINFTRGEVHFKQTVDHFEMGRQELSRNSVKTKQPRPKFNLNVAVLLAAAVAISLLMANELGAPSGTSKPVISISMHSNDVRLLGEAMQLRDALLTALTQFSTLSIQTSPSESANAKPLNYKIELKYYQNQDSKNVWWAVRDVQSSEIVQSGIDSVPQEGRSSSIIRDALVPVLAAHFAASRSVINLSELKKSEVHDLGNVCVLRADLITESAIAGTIRDVRSCLERTLRESPNDSDANAALAQVLLIPTNGKGIPTSLLRSQELARNAVMISQMSDRALTATMLTQFYSGKVSAAIDTGQKAIAANPNNPTTLGLFAWVLFANGDWGKAVDFANAGGRVPSVTPTSVQLVLAFDAYRRRDWLLAAILAEPVNSQGKLLTALRIAALGQLGVPEGNTQLRAARSEDPNFISQIETRLEYERIGMPIRKMVLQGLHKAATNGSGVISGGAM